MESKNHHSDYVLTAQNWPKKHYRVCTKIYRVYTKVYRVCTKIFAILGAFIPCLHESFTVFARKHTVFRRKFYRVYTKVHRVCTKISPCLHESALRVIPVGYTKKRFFFGRMYVCNHFQIFLHTTTYSNALNFDYRVCTKVRRNHGT